MALLVAYFVLALTVSFACSLFESVMLSVTHTYISVLKKNGRRSGVILARLKKNINHPLAVILTFNTVANVIGAAGVGAQTYQVFGSRWVTLASVILTLLILVFSEIMPKTLGAAHFKTFAPFTAYILQGLIILFFPVVKILEGVSHFILRRDEYKSISRDEIRMMAEIGRNEGVLRKNEARMIENVLMLSEMRAEDILTPRAVLLAFQRDDTIAAVVDEHSPIRFSRIPAFGESLDDIVGVVLKNELLEAYHTGRGGDTIASLVKPLHAVPDSKPIADLLDEFINRREHLFLVVDEYGGTAGIVTLEDVVETSLGVEIVDELDTVEDMRSFALKRWKRRSQGGYL